MDEHGGAERDQNAERTTIASGARIVVVDDDVHNRRILSGLLRHHGYAVETTDTFDTGREALEAAAPALVVLGVSRGESPGARLLEWALHAPAMRDVPCVGLSTGIYVRHAADLGMRGARLAELLVTPVSPLEMLDAVRRALRARAG